MNVHKICGKVHLFMENSLSDFRGMRWSPVVISCALYVEFCCLERSWNHGRCQNYFDIIVKEGHNGFVSEYAQCVDLEVTWRLVTSCELWIWIFFAGELHQKGLNRFSLYWNGSCDRSQYLIL